MSVVVKVTIQVEVEGPSLSKDQVAAATNRSLRVVEAEIRDSVDTFRTGCIKVRAFARVDQP